MNIFDRYHEQYDVWYDKHKYAFLSEVAALRKVIPPDTYGLEIGAGTGRFAQALGIAVGIEPSDAMRAAAATRGVNVCPGVGEDLSFADETFDYVAIIIAICFVDDPLKVLQEAVRVLKKRGRIIIGLTCLCLVSIF